MLTRLLYSIVTVTLCLVELGCQPATFVVGLAPGGRQVTATAVQRDGRWGSDKVAIVDVSGLIANAPKAGLFSSGINPVADLAEMLSAAAADADVRAVILRINSPGGTVTASDMMYREVRDFRRRTGKPVVVMMMDLATSGGYYLACAGEHLMAYPTSITGSVGVILQTFSIKPALESIGIHTAAITSGSNKAAGSPLTRLTPEQRTIMQEMVDEFHQRFVAVVRDARPGIGPEHFDTVTDGRVFTGRQALEIGLIDELGDLGGAFAQAKALAGIDHADLWVYHRPLDYAATPYARSPRNPATRQVNLFNLDLHLPGVLGMDVGVYYVWRPDLTD